MQPSINPFYAARHTRRVATPQPAPRPRIVYAKLPLAPVNASPVPELTSLYHNAEAGKYGDRGYPGNCGGNLIRDLLRFFKPGTVYDPCTGSGTCRDVCKELGIYCWSSDLHQGFDACGPSPFHEAFAFCWLHPPYWRQKVYSGNPLDLSRAHAEGVPGTLRTVADEQRPGAAARRQAGRAYGRLQRLRGRIRPLGLLHQAARLPGRAPSVLHRHYPVQPRGQQQQESVPQQFHPRPARCVHGLREAFVTTNQQESHYENLRQLRD